MGTVIKGDCVIRGGTQQNFERMISQARPHWRRLGSTSNPPENILYITMRSPRRWHRRMACRPSRRSCSSYGSWRKPLTRLVAIRWICSRQSASATRFSEQACKACSRWGRTNVLKREANAATDSSANYRLIKNSIRLALEAVSLHGMEGEKELSMTTPRSLTTFATCMELSGLPVARDNWSGGARPITM